MNIKNSSKISYPEKNATLLSHKIITLSDKVEDTFYKLFVKPFSTILKLTVNNSSWRMFKLTVYETLKFAYDGNWKWLFALIQLVLLKRWKRYSVGHIAFRLRNFTDRKLKTLSDQQKIETNTKKCNRELLKHLLQLKALIKQDLRH